ncbi:DUF4956 domain-containing protein [Aerococcaceae bacterium DSM 109653]|uniref:DUF4956 domain-containing protein n=1 Tax=Fundicoccus ignavus TaxID=2664442 RepID=A0A6I2GKD1_9LACT|nr:DUF4956 domain-containing protein [Fundicoccus ignavus]MRI81683.1 DUF4956 domain-containing protein [Fundicoccus ignavus]MRI85981.1 DUF4956 domain-containing protein [Fundicoccus ignavus]
MSLFNSLLVESSASFTLGNFLICTVVSLILGGIIAASYMKTNQYNKGFVITLFVLPVIVQMVILLVSGSVGTGVAALGAFSLVRFRSIPGTAKEISSIFLAMAVGLATGTGYVGIAILFTLIVCATLLILNLSSFGDQVQTSRYLRITIPENLDYTSVFDDILAEFLTKYEILSVKTVDMGSLFRIEYQVVLKENSNEKELIDALRTRNGNLEISCSRNLIGKEVL